MGFIEEIENGVTIEIRTHRGFTEFEESLKNNIVISQMFGRHQFVFSKDGNEISLVEMIGLDDIWYWEIYCLKGKLFEDTESFKSKQEAENKILRYLDLEGCI